MQQKPGFRARDFCGLVSVQVSQVTGESGTGEPEWVSPAIGESTTKESENEFITGNATTWFSRL